MARTAEGERGESKGSLRSGTALVAAAAAAAAVEEVLVRLRHVYDHDAELYEEFSRELLSPVLRLVPSALSSLDAVRLSSRVVVSLRENCVACLVRKALPSTVIDSVTV
ncbi:hypothetical protein Esi_0815_0005 [Ectocarpus siliculosus]|uniref:Uncharacterized protein n=1 Tax=Ectocarpus siliculosus TaxID=2880 RepID=D7G7E7_ECTSI|nr:hypothetical protein Esi_0815_0005 [Ectocarpus siliculosus]|eukprot:CBJ33988.1 hypothetical protein Esi_0815_0005 [Ectocarpus siliculosus]